MIQISEARITDSQLVQMYTAVLVNADPIEYDLSNAERLAAAINRYYGDEFEGTVTPDQIREADINISQITTY